MRIADDTLIHKYQCSMIELDPELHAELQEGLDAWHEGGDLREVS